MKKIFFLAMLAVLASCAGSRHTVTSVTKRDSTIHLSQQLDSLYQVMSRKDSTYTRDSIYVYMKGDTFTQYVERTKYRWRVQTDTVIKERIKEDTLYITRTDSVTVDRIIEKPVKWYDQGFIWLGRLCFFAIILYVAAIYVRRKA